jgi:hypothetical protein
MLAGFATFLAFFILALCEQRAADRVAFCGGDQPIVAAFAVPDLRRTLQVLTIAFADRPFCPARTVAR